jgi:hypothetical protein
MKVPSPLPVETERHTKKQKWYCKRKSNNIYKKSARSPSACADCDTDMIFTRI